ncbi:putative ribonuclease H-like domain-containing protein, partial [Tanacetum coccineum]
IVKLNQTEFTAATYKTGLATVEEQLITYRKNEVLFSEEVTVLKREAACKYYEINVLKCEFEKVKQEKEGIEFKIEKFDKASKDLDKLLGSQITDKSKKGLGYNAVPPPHSLIYNRPKKLDLSYSGLDEFKAYDSEVSKQESNVVCDKKSDDSKENSDDSLVKEQVSKDTSSFVESPLNVDKETIFLDKKIESVKPKNHEKLVKKSVRYAEMYRSHSPRGNQRNWNGQKSSQLGSDFVMYNKACFICGSFDHVHAHCKYHQRERMVYGNNYNRVNYNYTTKKTHPNAQRNMVPRVVLMKTGLKPFNTARTVNTAYPKSTVYSANPMSCFSKLAQSTGKPQQDDTGFVDIGCSRHMTGNIAYLSDFKEFDGGYVAFGGGAHGGRITKIENLVDKKVENNQSDKGTEFKNNGFDDFCREKAVSTACYVQNRVLVVKPHNKTPYELFRGFKPALSFMRPFGCHVTILNTLDSLGKFDGKSDEGFFVGYSLSSKAFRVYNTRTRRVEENLHIGFLENKPMIERNGPKWLFDINSLTQSMNYVPVTAGTISNESAGTQGEFSVGTSEEIRQDCIVMPIWKDASYFDSPSKDDNGEPKSAADDQKQDGDGPNNENVEKDKFERMIQLNQQACLNIMYEFPYWVENARRTSEVNLQQVGYLGFAYWKEVLEQMGLQKQESTSLQSVQGTFGLIQAPRAVYVDDIIFGSTKKELCTRFEKLMKEKFLKSSMGELTFFLGLQVQQKEDGIFISQDKYVAEILKKFNYTDVKSASTPVDLEKPLVKDGDDDDVDVHLYRYMIGSLMYLIASRPDIMVAAFGILGFLFEVLLILIVNAGETQDEVYIGCVWFLGNRLISWQCKKQTMVATSTTKAEYVASANLLTKVLMWKVSVLSQDIGMLISLMSLLFMSDLHLEDAEGTDCLPTATIFEDLARIGRMESSDRSGEFGVIMKMHPNRGGVLNNIDKDVIDEVNVDMPVGDNQEQSAKEREVDTSVEDSDAPITIKEITLAQTLIQIKAGSRKLKETEESSKGAEDEVEANKSKKAKSTKEKAKGSRKKMLDEHEEVEEDDEAELKKHLVIVKDDEIVIDDIPLATNPPVIVEYKLLKEGIMKMNIKFRGGLLGLKRLQGFLELLLLSTAGTKVYATGVQLLEDLLLPKG